MSRTPLYKIDCGRCGRSEFLKEDELSPEDAIDLVLTFLGETLQFKELCSKCKETVGNYVKSIKKEAKKKGDEPPSSSTPPNDRASS